MQLALSLSRFFSYEVNSIPVEIARPQVSLGTTVFVPTTACLPRSGQHIFELVKYSPPLTLFATH